MRGEFAAGSETNAQANSEYPPAQLIRKITKTSTACQDHESRHVNADRSRALSRILVPSRYTSQPQRPSIAAPQACKLNLRFVANLPSKILPWQRPSRLPPPFRQLVVKGLGLDCAGLFRHSGIQEDYRLRACPAVTNELVGGPTGTWPPSVRRSGGAGGSRYPCV